MATIPISAENAQDKGGGQEGIASGGSTVPPSDQSIEGMEFDRFKRKNDDDIHGRAVKGKTKDDGVPADLVINQELQSDDTQEVSNNVVVIELIGKTKEEKLIYDKTTILIMVFYAAVLFSFYL